jgi:hypothetical protein
MKTRLRLTALLLASARLAFGQEAPAPLDNAAQPPPEAPPAGAELPPGAVVPETGAPAVDGGMLEGTGDFLSKLAGDVNISSTGGAEVVDFQKGIFRYKGGVNIKYRGVEILGDGAEFNRSTGDITVRGDVSIFRNGMLYKGSTAVYNIKSETISSDNLRSSILAGDKEIYFQTQELASGLGGDDLPSLIETSGSMLTTHDSSHPNWQLQSRKLDIYPEDRMVFRNMRVYAGGTPVFWLPYLSQPMDDELGYTFSPGYDSVWGAYLLNRYGTLLGDDGHTLATFHLDLRSERGIAGGVDFRSTRHGGDSNFGKLQLYFANDLDPSMSRNSRERLAPPDENRYRASLQHRFYLRGYDDSVAVDQETGRKSKRRSNVPVDDSFYVDADLTLLSDEFFLEDFYPSEFRLDPQPDNQISLIKTNPYWSASLMGRFRINDFFQSDTRLPELAFDVVRTPIFGSNFFYEGSTSLGLLEEKVPDQFARSQNERVASLRQDLATYDAGDELGTLNPEFDPVETRTLLDQLEFGLAERGFTRFDTYHQVAYPTQLGPVSLVPRAGLRFTSYSDVSGVFAEDSDRAIFHGGLDGSIKFSKEYDGVYSRALGLDGLRHIVQPYFRYSIVQGDELDEQFPSIDRLTPTTRPRPIDLSRYTAIDTIDNWNLVRLGVFNRWHTKRDGHTHEWLAMNTYMDTYLEDPEFDRDFSNLYWETTWSPLPWLRLGLETQFDVMGEEEGFNETNTYVTWMPTSTLEFSVGNRFLTSHPFLPESNQVDFQLFYRLADEWGFSAYQRWELDDSVLETQQYSIHRDLVSWTAALGAIMRDNRGEDEFGVVFTMTLKEFPQVSLPLNLDPQGAAGN